ncbi:MAG TPA: hypothetical protein VLD85_14545 [Anaeromyxobacteraceae bacterium]|nr:hypothetical protein [Anaeromyxobacteraceae bacterium]
MAKRNPRRGEPPAAGTLVPAYEGPEVLSALLARAGSPHSAEEVADRFAQALAAGEERAEAIPALFPREPRFASPEEARRLYQNLFGLWSRVAAGRGAEAGEPEAEEPDLPPPLPERGSVPGDRLPADLVEATWRHLAGVPQAEARRARHRFESAQADLVAWLAATELPESGGAAAVDLCFEAWAMLDQAFGDRLGTAPWRALEELASEPPPLESEQPALAAYAAEQLDNLGDDDPAFGPAERAQVERVLATAVTAMVRTME